MQGNLSIKHRCLVFWCVDISGRCFVSPCAVSCPAGFKSCFQSDPCPVVAFFCAVGPGSITPFFFSPSGSRVSDLDTVPWWREGGRLQWRTRSGFTVRICPRESASWWVVMFTRCSKICQTLTVKSFKMSCSSPPLLHTCQKTYGKKIRYLVNQVPRNVRQISFHSHFCLGLCFPSVFKHCKTQMRFWQKKEEETVPRLRLLLFFAANYFV